MVIANVRTSVAASSVSTAITATGVFRCRVVSMVAVRFRSSASATRDGTVSSARNLSVARIATHHVDTVNLLESAAAGLDGLEPRAVTVKCCQDVCTERVQNLWNASASLAGPESCVKLPSAPRTVAENMDIADAPVSAAVESDGWVKTVASVTHIRDVRTVTVADLGNATVNPAGEECCAMRS